MCSQIRAIAVEKREETRDLQVNWYIAMMPARLSIDANVRLHPKMVLIPLLGLMHLLVARATIVLGGTGLQSASRRSLQRS